ncbi:hypothetical protein PR048_002433 [Dryococelus australis]|uniref:Uncharacterized protein n=1 Tax=Dryococelus australis TaxID=614101 RepID=A0ABQ9IKB0_9NEOP|nr:hypothetical protein PR048_002433 [Dryococelus australis]
MGLPRENPQINDKFATFPTRGEPARNRNRFAVIIDKWSYPYIAKTHEIFRKYRMFTAGWSTRLSGSWSSSVPSATSISHMSFSDPCLQAAGGDQVLRSGVPTTNGVFHNVEAEDYHESGTLARLLGRDIRDEFQMNRGPYHWILEKITDINHLSNSEGGSSPEAISTSETRLLTDLEYQEQQSRKMTGRHEQRLCGMKARQQQLFSEMKGELVNKFGANANKLTQTGSAQLSRGQREVETAHKKSEQTSEVERKLDSEKITTEIKLNQVGDEIKLVAYKLNDVIRSAGEIQLRNTSPNSAYPLITSPLDRHKMEVDEDKDDKKKERKEDEKEKRRRKKRLKMRKKEIRRRNQNEMPWDPGGTNRPDIKDFEPCIYGSDHCISKAWEYLSKKLMPLYVGPVRISKICNRNCYEVVCLETGKVIGKYNIMALRVYQHHGSKIPTHTESRDQVSFCPFAPREVSVLAELALGHLRYHLTDVPPQSNSPTGSVVGSDHAGVYATRAHATTPQGRRTASINKIASQSKEYIASKISKENSESKIYNFVVGNDNEMYLYFVSANEIRRQRHFQLRRPGEHSYSPLQWLDSGVSYRTLADRRMSECLLPICDCRLLADEYHVQV